MIRRLALRNFKSWHQVDDMRMAPVTGLFGPNSSGKTSILQALLLLKQTVESPDRTQVLAFGDERSLVSLGTYRDLVHGQDIRESVAIGLDWLLPKPLRVKTSARGGAVIPISGAAIGFHTYLSVRDDNGPAVDRLDYRLGDSQFGMMRTKDKDYLLTAETPDTPFYFVRSLGRKWPLPAPVKCYGFPDQVRTYYQNAGFLADLELEFQELCGRIFYLGPLREYPHRQYTWPGGTPRDVGWRGEQVVEALLASRSRGKANSRGYRMRRISVETHVAVWLQELGLIHSFEVQAIDAAANLYRVVVRITERSAPVLLTDVGFGVSQVLPALTLLAYVPEGSIVILEQPEIHLHPAVQAGLADVIVEAATVRKVQVIVESHSEHLLLRLQRRVAEAKLSPEDVALYFCAMREGHSTLEPLALDIFGDIRNWPEAFFGDRFEERAAMVEAATRRRMVAES